MVVRALVVRADGTTFVRRFEGERPSLEWMQDTVGGMIEFVQGLPCTVVANADATRLCLPRNRLATERFGESAGDLRGDVIVIEFLSSRTDIPAVG
jgi:hypothetical protein